MTRFQSTLSLRRATNSSIIFYIFKLFQSTLSLRRATGRPGRNPEIHLNFNPRSPCGERPWDRINAIYHRQISIHALLAESDPDRHSLRCVCNHFNPRSPCGERPWVAPPWVSFLIISIHALLAESDMFRARGMMVVLTFQSTLSLRRATRAYKTMCYQTMYFNPRSPCGERRSLHTRTPPFRLISIHALLAESDDSVMTGCLGYLISIHALLAESDRL